MDSFSIQIYIRLKNKPARQFLALKAQTIAITVEATESSVAI